MQVNLSQVAEASLSMKVLLTFGPEAPTLLLAVSEDRSEVELTEWFS